MVPYLYPAPFRLDESTCNGSLADKLYAKNHDIHDRQESLHFCRGVGYRIHFLTTLFIHELGALL
jgi:hypothetical protein